jgi:peptide/nickel transport system substrate-binding protein
MNTQFNGDHFSPRIRGRTEGTPSMAQGAKIQDDRRRLTRRDFLRAGAGMAASAAVAGAARSVPAVAAAPKRGGTVVFATAALMASIDPHLEGADIWQKRKPLVYENLVWIDYNLMPQPQLAEGWEKQSDTVYVFKVREGVKFHNGQTMDAEDVKYSYERVMDPKVGSGGRGDLVMIKRIDLVDRYTLRFVLNAPAASFLINLGGKYNGVIPKGSAPTGKELLQRALGTGPFAVTEFQPNQRLVLRRHDAYWQPGVPYLDGITFVAVPDESSIVAGLRTDQVQFADFASTINYFQVRRVGHLDVIRAPSIRWVVLDLAGDIAPTNNPDVRRAIELAVDRPAILQTAGSGLGERLGVLPPAMKGWAMPFSRLPNQNPNPDEARALLRKALPGGQASLVIRNIVGFPELAASVQVIADNLKRVGLTVRVETVDIGVWIKDFLGRRSPSTMNVWGGFVDPDDAFYVHYHTPPQGRDFRRWNNKAMDALLDQGRVTPDRTERKHIYDKVQVMLADDPISVPLYAPDLVYAMQKSIRGFRPHPTGFYYGVRYLYQVA